MVSIVIQNLTRREKEMLMNNEATTIEEIYSILKKYNSMANFYQLEEPKAIESNRDTSINFKPTKYCKFHRSNFHDSSECRAQIRKNKTKGSTNTKTLIINSTQAQNHLTTSIEVNNKKHEFVIDTGSYHNFISEKFAKQISQSFTVCQKAIKLADGREVKIVKKLKLRFKFEQIAGAIKEDFFILEDLTIKGLIGLELLQKYNFSINCTNGKLVRSLGPKEPVETPDTSLVNKLDSIYPSFNFNFSDLNLPFTVENPTASLGLIKGVQMELTLKDNIPVHKRPYFIPPSQIKQVKDEINRLLKVKNIVKSNSMYASPAFTVPKKTGEIRLVIDYRELNKKR